MSIVISIIFGFIPSIYFFQIDRASAGNMKRSKGEETSDTEPEDEFGYTASKFLRANLFLSLSEQSHSVSQNYFFIPSTKKVSLKQSEFPCREKELELEREKYSFRRLSYFIDSYSEGNSTQNAINKSYSQLDSE
jgi:hypothetical protein